MIEGEMNMKSHQFPFHWGAISDTGQVREENQDTHLVDPELGLFLVSDGMGGHRAGALASKIVAEVLPVMIADRLKKLKTRSTRAIRNMLRKAILELSKHLRTESSNQTGFKGMGATLVMALLHEGHCFIANMGDSRAYRFRNGGLSQLSEDHSVVGLLLRAGEITSEQAKDHATRGQLSRYIGMLDEVYPYLRTISSKEQDRILLCSDGLTGVVDDKEIATILRSEADPQATCQALIDAANAIGGPDNITVVIIDWHNYYKARA